MEKSFRYSFLFSLFLHFLFFYLTTQVGIRKITFIPIPSFAPIPVELVRISLPAEIAPIIQEKKKSEEIVLPKKEAKKAKKTKPKEEVKPEPVKPKEEKEEKKEAPPPPISAVPSGRQYGSGVSLEAARFPYTYYLNLVREKIGKNWHWPSLSANRKTVIYFRILRDGRVEQIKTKQSSGEESFDLAALRAIEISAPFPPLPDRFPDEYLGVYFEFSLQ